MTTRYQESQIKDVARIIEDLWLFPDAHEIISSLAGDFANLFAVDNLPSSRCWTCGNTKEAAPICTRPDGDHRFGGFNRERFLAACGLESGG